MTAELIHATAIAINHHGVLLVGPSGSGKSDLAVRLIDRGAVLISDDAVCIGQSEQKPVLHAAPNIGGRIELRGVGIIEVQHTPKAAMRMVRRIDCSGRTDPAGKSVRRYRRLYRSAGKNCCIRIQCPVKSRICPTFLD